MSDTSLPLRVLNRHSQLTANQPIDNYWVRAATPPDDQPKLVGFEGGINSAILRYVGAPKRDSQTHQRSHVNLLQETDLHPLVDPTAVSVGCLSPLLVDFSYTLGSQESLFQTGRTCRLRST